MLVFCNCFVDFWSNFGGPDPYENTYICTSTWFRKVFEFSEKLLKKAPGDPTMEPQSLDFREKIAKNRQDCENK